MSMEEFLGHSTRDSGNASGNYLENWKKKRTPPQIDTFIHPGSRIIAVWQHAWPKMVTRKDKQTGAESVEVWGGTFNSHESEAVLRKQYHREPKVTGSRVVEPTVCPMSMMIEAVHTAIREGRLDWCEELFRFVGTDTSKAKILHAGGLYNAYGHNSVTDKQKAEVAAAGISLKTSWQENMMAKCNYIFTIVDADNPGIGPQVTTETTLLGDKVKTAIKDEMTSSVCAADPQGMQGNPIVNPYCIRWVHQPTAVAFGDKYKALIMRKIDVTDEIQSAFDEDAPDVSFLARKGNVAKLRDSMEGAYVGPDGILDFDAIFAPSEAQYAEDNPSVDSAEDAAETAKAVRKPAAVADKVAARTPEVRAEATPAKRKRRTKVEIARDKREDELLAMVLSEGDLIAVLDDEGHTEGFVATMTERLEALQSAVETPEPEVADDDEAAACEVCEGEMLMSDDTCPHCGAKYDMETGAVIVEEKPKPRSRSAAKKAGGESGDRITF